VIPEPQPDLIIPVVEEIPQEVPVRRVWVLIVSICAGVIALLAALVTVWCCMKTYELKQREKIVEVPILTVKCGG
jgi:hypothetical protein